MKKTIGLIEFVDLMTEMRNRYPSSNIEEERWKGVCKEYYKKLGHRDYHITKKAMEMASADSERFIPSCSSVDKIALHLALTDRRNATSRMLQEESSSSETGPAEALGKVREIRQKLWG